MNIFSCREVSQRIAESPERRLSPVDHLGISCHLMMCSLCRRFKRQLEFLHTAAATYSRRTIKLPVPSELQLTEAARLRIMARLNVDRGE